MSIYATFFTIADDVDHERSCDRHAVLPTREHWVSWHEGGETGYDETRPCTCSALGGPFVYRASNGSITGPDHPRGGSVYCCRAVGSWTMRLSVHDGTGEDAVVLLDRRQVEAMRDALTEFLGYWDDPADYDREAAYDAALPTPEQLVKRQERNAEFEELLVVLKRAAEES